ncbi:NAD-dependent epimerase/dehydratase family protein [Francisella philomiragia]|uniref:NAD-dependent epimerase/dehydratase family protein n=1 Tax=Francisella philomiragia TaxID=28110 RepID=UPI0019086286|nr:NAD-dependent epimerase/dehydratase family protein [Francisella philomiragia]MBK2093295.1 NAD-dependent epimerase/dehydratase family protein [Francisella philomiragia]MBK2256559.1 NAD-dependent epimerase/dehydratase family protein [Francisella philomiragia]MBK2269217.1 NAD-dependent epimerase/dehydratase family protein [Francisella philomiragia]MBK2271418.1 NAD-dependent epimerase/dehydratase family protein [Francisella philomiragia]MBK2275198.1 NAD-dependent epimerase/dehydratase family pr
MMRKVLITGLNSYVGNSFEKSCKSDFVIEKISLKDESWQTLDFSKYDAILHVAGIAHTSKDPSLKDKYYAVNTELTYELAKIAKNSGVKQFVFMSSIIVYGDSAPIGQQKIITKDTLPQPDDFYGDSKLQAELKLKTLVSEDFSVAIVRPPMVYGEGSKGNYPKLVKLAKYAFIFPKIANQRSVIHIDNLTSQLKDIISNNYVGIFLPQDDKYFCTSEFIKEYRQKMGKKTYLIAVFNSLIKLLATKIGFLNKVFGSMIYKK